MGYAPCRQRVLLRHAGSRTRSCRIGAWEVTLYRLTDGMHADGRSTLQMLPPIDGHDAAAPVDEPAYSMTNQVIPCAATFTGNSTV